MLMLPKGFDKDYIYVVSYKEEAAKGITHKVFG